MNGDYNYILIAVGLLIILDIGLDVLRLLNQAVLENWLKRVDEKLEVIRTELDGKGKQLLEMAQSIADAAGYKRGREDQAEERRADKNG